MNQNKIEIIMGDGSETPEAVKNAVLNRIADLPPLPLPEPVPEPSIPLYPEQHGIVMVLNEFNKRFGTKPRPRES